MLFMDGGLILMKIELTSLSMSEAADIVMALKQDYGKERITKSSPFTTHTWRKGSKVLLVEHSSSSGDDYDMTVIMRDEAAYKVFQQRSDHNRLIFRALDQKATKNDMRD